MSVDFPFDDAVRFSPADDRLHPIGADKPDWCETVWFSFHVPERSLGGWLYVQTRPNLGVSSGGAFVYGPGAWAEFEQPYFAYLDYAPMPAPLDLRDVSFANGVSVRMVEPAMVYDLGYRFRDHDECIVDLRFEGLTEPVPHVRGAPPFTGSSHYDQHGHVTGTLRLHGEEIPVDCYAVRDRSWGRRPEKVGRRVPRLSYVFGATGPDEGFLVFCTPDAHDAPDGEAEVESLSSGYLFRDGALRRLASVTRRNARDPRTGGVSRIELDGADVDGRPLRVHGEAVSAMALHRGSLCINTLLRFDVDGRVGWGEDQDVWPAARFARARAAARAQGQAKPTTGCGT